jgi:hypothetical protein
MFLGCLPTVIAETKLRDGGSFGCLLVGRLDRAEVKGARPEYRNAPRPELGRLPFGGGPHDGKILAAETDCEFREGRPKENPAKLFLVMRAQLVKRVSAIEVLAGTRARRTSSLFAAQ